MKAISAVSPCFVSQLKTVHPFVLPPSPQFPKPSNLVGKLPHRFKFQCSRRPSPGESDSKAVLDAFFLGKALAEALNERIGSTVGEFLSVIGQWQAEQQKQAQDFQEEVLERARKAKEKAAREAMEEQGIKPKSLLESTETGNASISSPPSDPADEVPSQDKRSKN